MSLEELANAAGAHDTDAAAVREAFLQAVRQPPAAFRRQLSSVSLTAEAWNRRDPPPFISYLLFTCFAAASLDADTVDLGQFRERVRKLLKHKTGTTYAFSDLSHLWEALAAWLQDRHDAGERYRTLTLPDRGHMTLIGYSVRLAFPRRVDRLRLREVLVNAGAAPTPTVPEAFRAIGRGRHRFSSDFRSVFDRARDAFSRGRDIPELHALWSAVLETSLLSIEGPVKTIRVRYQLLAQEDDLGRSVPFVVAAGVRPSRLPGGTQFSSLEEPLDGFDHLVCGPDGSPESITALLLSGALQDRVPGLKASAVQRTVHEGVLLFQRIDSATWELASTRPTEGRIRALVRDDFSASFLGLLSGSRRRAFETRFKGWQEVGDFDATELAVPRGSGAGRLASVRCLEAVEVGAHLHVIGGIRVDGGFLGIRGVLPEVQCTDAEDAAVYRVLETSEEPQSKLVTALQVDAVRPGVFRWPAETGDLDGTFMITGVRGGHVIASREVLLHSRALTHRYTSPTDPARWFVEASTSDVAPAATALDAYVGIDLDGVVPSPPIDTVLAERLPLRVHSSVDDDRHHDNLTEVLAAVSVARKGIAEAELIDLFGQIIPGAAGFIVWAILRGWVEAGYLDCVMRRNWRGRVYFARRPRLVLMSEEYTIRVVLHGLAPYRLRMTVRDAMSSHGGTPLVTASLSSFVPTPLSWRLESLEHAKAVSKELVDLDVVNLCPIGTLAGAFDAVVCDEAPLPPGYELQRVWNWATGGFRRPNRTEDSDDVRIEHHTRTNGPDRYVVVMADRRRMTLSRTWALLQGFRCAGRKAFSSLGSVVIVRSGEDGPHVPVPIARSVALRAGIVGGPADTLGSCYLYAAVSAPEQRWLLRWLHGLKADPATVRQLAWLLAVASAYGGDSIAIPRDLRQRLRSFDSLPDAASLAGRRVPRHLIAHIRRTIERAET